MSDGPASLHGTCLPNGAARDSEQRHTDAGILAEFCKDLGSLAGRDFAVEAYVANGTSLERLLDNVQRRSPEREDNAALISEALQFDSVTRTISLLQYVFRDRQPRP